MNLTRPFVLVAVLALLAQAHGSASAQGLTPRGGSSADEALPELEGVEVVEKLRASLPLDLEFRDETGAPIELGSLFGDGLPVLLTFNYSDCPMLCSVQLSGLVDVLNKMELEAGVQFRIITVGLNHEETHRRAMETKMAYLERYQKPKANEGWRFLTGDKENIRKLADIVGFGYRWDAEKKEVFHSAALMVISPQGMVSSYVYGVAFEPIDMRTAIIAAGLEQVTESTAKFLLSCFHYEKATGLAGMAQKAMRIGGFLFVCGLLVAAFFAFRIRSTRSLRTQRTGSTA